MKVDEINHFLFQFNEIEKVQQQTGESINDIQNLSSNFEELFDARIGYVRLPKEPFFKGSNIYISKHNRFAPMIEHVHDFIEINYVYAGSCIQTINGKKVALKTGSVCVLDRDIPHSIEPLTEEDILINILINDQTFSSLFLFQLEKDHSLLGNFLSSAFNTQATHDSFVLFESADVPQIHLEIQLLLREYWSQEDDSESFISQYLQLIISELMRIYREKSQLDNSQTGLNYIEVLEYIDQNYQELKLSDLKAAFNYNSNYISNTLKKATGKNFQEILLEKKLLIAKDLLQNSEQSIEAIAQLVGFNSLSYFYRQFKKKYQLTPKQYRTQTQSSLRLR